MPRICGTAWVLTPDNEVLLIQNLKLGLWLPPGGGLKEGETPLETTLRELKEETGIVEADLIAIQTISDYPDFPVAESLVRNQMPVTVETFLGNLNLIHNYLFRYTGSLELTVNEDEVGGYRWHRVGGDTHSIDTTYDVRYLIEWIRQGWGW